MIVTSGRASAGAQIMPVIETERLILRQWPRFRYRREHRDASPIPNGSFITAG